MANVPEFPPSNLICTTDEWTKFYYEGKDARRGDLPRTSAPEGKARAPWLSGWDAAERDRVWLRHDYEESNQR